ncbi:MAG: hypothetical protein CMJ76_15520 [Planctomycetaceae bacterium]|nr:hypothetical protein [Planctomycetaceae bacterium]|tara:strand:+ start:4480 stop:5193 length:714 start_codon:yes stop_codon:yes gene_type:complete
MCGRFTLKTSLNTLGEHFLFDVPADITLAPKYNIAPTHSIATLLWNGGRRHYGRMHWGLIPRWAKDNSMAGKMINARSETIREKPSFREAFKSQRCLILADGYYEWKPDKSSRQPVYIHHPDHQPFAFAGLWEIWTPPQQHSDGQVWWTATIITTDANEITSNLHHRMPVILDPENYDSWLNPNTDNLDALHESLIQPPQQNQMDKFKMTTVSTRVNSVKNDDPECIKPDTIQQGLF